MPSVTLHRFPEMPEAPAAAPPARPVQVERLRDLAERIAPMHVLRRTGLRTFAFNGQLLGTVCGVDQVLPFWYEINVYRTVLGTYVSDIRLFGKGVDAADLFRVAEHDTMEALQEHFEHYDSSCDLPPIAYDSDTGATSAAALTLRAIEVQAEIRRIADHYQVTVGALLNALPD